MRLGLLAVLLCTGPISADLPQVQAVQDHVRKLIAEADSGIAAIIVSSNPAYPALSPAERTHPGVLGGYRGGRRSDGIVPMERDKLDLADARNTADNIFGSGVVLTPDGLVLTNWHVVESARKIYVRFHDGRGGYADIHAADARSDLAVLRLIEPIDPPRIPIRIANVRFHDSGTEKANVYRGLFVLALAHPFAAGFQDGQPSASSGIIANIRRRSPGATREEGRNSLLAQYSNLLQTDARVNLGASGGALLNLDGELIGLLTATAAVAGSDAAGGYAIPMDNIYRRIVERLKEGLEIEYGFLGVVPDGMIRQGIHYGLMISNVSEGTPAGIAGLRPRDILLRVDGRPIRELEDLFFLIGGSLAGTSLNLEVLRDGKVRTLKPQLAKLAHNHTSIASVKPPSVFGLRVDYSSLIAQQPIFFGERRRVTTGVIIRELEPDSPAAAKLQPLLGGKTLVITSVNGSQVSTPREFYAAAQGAKSVMLTLVGATDPSVPERTITLP